MRQGDEFEDETMTPGEPELAPMDLTALGPSMTSERLDQLVAMVVRRGAPELERRRSGGALPRQVFVWRRPVLITAGLAAAAAVVLLLRTPAPTVGPADHATLAQAAEPASTGTVAEALGIPAAFAESVEGRSPAGNTATAPHPDRESP